MVMLPPAGTTPALVVSSTTSLTSAASSNSINWPGVRMVAFTIGAPPTWGEATAKLTPEYAARFERKLDRARKGLEWDYLSYCLNPGFPRWLTEPLLKEFVLQIGRAHV